MAEILLVDDNPHLLGCMALQLKRRLHDVIVAADGAIALNLLGTRKVDVVITDIFMPNTDGLEFAIEVRRRLPGLPIIGMSGGDLNMLSLTRHAMEGLGGFMFFQKPITATQLDTAIRKMLGA